MCDRVRITYGMAGLVENTRHFVSLKSIARTRGISRFLYFICFFPFIVLGTILSIIWKCPFLIYNSPRTSVNVLPLCRRFRDTTLSLSFFLCRLTLESLTFYPFSSCHRRSFDDRDLLFSSFSFS